MTPLEKANELVEKMIDNYYTIPELMEINKKQSIKNALISVDEILSAIDKNILSLSANLSRKYWEQVKQEIEKL